MCTISVMFFSEGERRRLSMMTKLWVRHEFFFLPQKNYSSILSRFASISIWFWWKGKIGFGDHSTLLRVSFCVYSQLNNNCPRDQNSNYFLCAPPPPSHQYFMHGAIMEIDCFYKITNFKKEEEKMRCAHCASWNDSPWQKCIFVF